MPNQPEVHQWPLELGKLAWPVCTGVMGALREIGLAGSEPAWSVWLLRVGRTSLAGFICAGGRLPLLLD
jgi:hypothetical protein